jgi:transcriptional regulator with XRE-family HTH domain
MTLELQAAAIVKEARQRSGLTQRELAQRAGTSQSVVARIESGQTSPSVTTLRRLLDAAGTETRIELGPMLRPATPPPGTDQDPAHPLVEPRLHTDVTQAAELATPPAPGTEPATKAPNVFTVDLEDWYQGLEIDMDDWAGFAPRVEVGMRVLLGLLADANVRATFFVLGWQAERTPSLIRELARQGHEVASHGYSHRFVYRQSPEQFRAE